MTTTDQPGETTMTTFKPGDRVRTPAGIIASRLASLDTGVLRQARAETATKFALEDLAEDGYQIIDANALAEHKASTLARILATDERTKPEQMASLEGRFAGIGLAEMCIDAPKDEPQACDSAQDSHVPVGNKSDGLRDPETAEGYTEADIAAWIRVRADQLDGFDGSEFHSSFVHGCVVGTASDLRVAADEIDALRRLNSALIDHGVRQQRPSPLPPPAPTKTTGEVLGEIRERLIKADTALLHKQTTANVYDNTRLAGKREGVSLAIDYLRGYEP